MISLDEFCEFTGFREERVSRYLVSTILVFLFLGYP
jgi:hypothetical protein